MRQPRIYEHHTNRQFVDVFGGYNHNLRINENEFYDMQNMTSDYWPLLAPRGKRGTYRDANHVQNIISKEKLCYVEDGDFVIGTDRYSMGLQYANTLVSMGAYVIILPDKKYINTQDPEDRGDIEATYEINGDDGVVVFDLCNKNGDVYDIKYSSMSTPPSNADGSYWFDTGIECLKQDTANGWVIITDVYVKMSATGIGAKFEDGDFVKVEGMEWPLLAEMEGTYQEIVCKGDNYIIVRGKIQESGLKGSKVKLSRTMPDMDFIIESGNRLWGCKYGDGLNEIYASKLNDFKNWHSFAGIASDSYVVSRGSDGPFTGAISYQGYPLFFKETILHKVYGDYPANFGVQDTPCRGVMQGAGASLAIVNEVLYYQTRGCICAYDGSLPVNISDALDGVRYSGGVAGAHGNKYYISMRDLDHVWHLFVYDTQRKLWHREDGSEIPIAAFCSFKDEMYFTQDGKIRTMCGSGTLDTEPVEWFVETGDLGLSSPDRKYLDRLTIRLSMAVGSRVVISAQYDDIDEWYHLVTITSRRFGSTAIPVRPQRCDHLRLRIEGKGHAKIYSISKVMQEGSDNW